MSTTTVIWMALKERSLKGNLATDKYGQAYSGHVAHYATEIFRLAGTGCPRYESDTAARLYLDKLPTAGDVRQTLARHQSAPQKTQR